MDTLNERALELLEKTESSLVSLMTDAIKTHAYGELATIAGITEATAAIRSARGGTQAPVERSTAPASALPADASSPSWMRRASS